MENTFSGFQSDFSDIQNEYDSGFMKVNKATGGQKAMGVGMNALSYAGTGATIGAAFGGIGAPIGAAIGAVAGNGKVVFDMIQQNNIEDDQTKTAEKYNATLEQFRDARIRGRALANNMRASQAMASMQESNINDYFSDIENPY